MTNSQKLLQNVKRALGDASTYAAAKAMGVSRQAASKWELGQCYMDDDSAIKAAEITGMDPIHALALVAEDRAPSEPTKRIWRQVQKKAAAGVAKFVYYVNFLITEACSHGMIRITE